MPCASGSKLTPGRAVVSRGYGRTGAIHSSVGALAARSRACGRPARAMTCGSCGGATRHGPPPAISGPLSCRSTKPSTSSLPKPSSGSGLGASIRYKPCKAKLRGAIHIGHSTGGGEVTRYIGRHGTGRVAKAVLLSAVPPQMLKTPANPGGLPMDVFDGLRAASLADRSKFYRDLGGGPFYGFNRPGARV